MEIKEALVMIQNIHEEQGDNNFINIIRDVERSINKSKNFNDWKKELMNRTDLSQDYKWELECFDESVKVVFALMGKW